MVESAPDGGGEHFGSAWDQLNQFADMIVREGEKRGLVGPRELDRLWTRHILNSSAVLDFVPEAGSVIDVGSGAGFPGLVVAICRPKCSVTLVDSMERRCTWLEDAVDELGLQADDLRRTRQDILAEAAGRTDLQSRMNDMIAFLEEMPEAITDYSETLTRRLVDRITIFDEKIVVELKSGLEMEVEA